MKNLYKCICIVFVLIFFNSFICFANSAIYSNNSMKYLCSAPSYIPNDGIPIDIGGELFSYFEGKLGVILCPRFDFTKMDNNKNLLYEDETACYGQFYLNLKEMKRYAPCNYSLDGEICMVTSNGKQLFNMENLDYVYNSNEQKLYYRIRASQVDDKILNKNSMFLLGSVCNGDCPLLIGHIACISENDIVKQTYAFYIKGRDSFNAECHQKKIIRLTAFNIK